ncbi:hypothetical protein ACFLQW_03250 [Candidatus Zixiibacteriota bacterium]
MKRLVLFVAFPVIIGVMLWLTAGNSPAVAGVSPAMVGNTDGDSIIVSFAVNDTLGNAANCDSAWVVQFYNGRVFDSTRLTDEYGSRNGLYATVCKAAAGDSCGAYWVQVRVYGVSERNPHTTYAYTVVDHGPPGKNDIAVVVADSNLAREVTKGDYQSTTGPGAIPVYVHCLNAQDSTSIQGVKLNVKLAADQTWKHRTLSGGDGWAPMTLEEYDHHVYATANGYYFPVPACTLAVTGDSLRDTVWATAFDPGSPGDPELCRVYGWIYDLSGAKMAGAEITTRLIGAPVRYQNVTISPYAKSSISDSSGYWFLDIFPTVSLTPDTVKYEFTIRHTGGPIVRRKVSVPDTTSWQLSW